MRRKLDVSTDQVAELAARFLPHHDLPPLDRACSGEALLLWLERVELSKKAFLAVGKWNGLEDFLALNPAWPLRHAVELMLEIAAEKTA